MASAGTSVPPSAGPLLPLPLPYCTAARHSDFAFLRLLFDVRLSHLINITYIHTYIHTLYRTYTLLCLSCIEQPGDERLRLSHGSAGDAVETVLACTTTDVPRRRRSTTELSYSSRSAAGVPGALHESADLLLDIPFSRRHTSSITFAASPHSSESVCDKAN